MKYIYKLYNSKKPEMLYIGSTSGKLSTRKCFHKQHYKSFVNKRSSYKKYSCYPVFEIEDGEVKIEALFTYEDENDEIDSYTLRLKEKEFILKYKNDNNYILLNKNIPCRTKEEYKIDNKDKINEIARNYYYNSNQRNKINCDRCNASVMKKGIYRHYKTNKCIKNSS